MSPRLQLALRFTVTVVLLVLVASGIDWSLVGDRLGQGNRGWLVLSLVAVTLTLVVGAVRWDRLLEFAGIHVPAGRLARIYAVSTFAQSFLPTGVGGDAARVLMVARRGPMVSRVLSTVLIDRAAGLAGILILSWLMLAGFPEMQVPSGSVLGLAVISGLVLAGVALALAAHRVPPRVRAWVPDVLARPLAIVVGDVRTLVRTPAAAAFVLGTSLAFQAFNVLQIWAIAQWVGVSLSYPATTLALALVTLAMLVPISVGGFGVREGSYVVLLGSLGISTTDATLISVVSVLVLLIASLPGAFLLVTGGVAPLYDAAGDYQTVEEAPR